MRTLWRLSSSASIRLSPPFATFFQNLSNTLEAKSVDDCSCNVLSDWVRQSPMEIHSQASIIKERARVEESDSLTAV